MLLSNQELKREENQQFYASEEEFLIEKRQQFTEDNFIEKTIASRTGEIEYLLLRKDNTYNEITEILHELDTKNY